MNEFKIYQVKAEHIREYGFCSLDLIRREHPDQLGLPREAWDLIYTYETEEEPSLEWLFCLFNRGMEGCGIPPTPEHFGGHSMSVSDIIETPDGRLWFCDSKGWQEIQWES